MLAQGWVGICQDIASVQRKIRQRADGDRVSAEGNTTRTQVAVREKMATDRILRLRQLSHALCVLVRFFESRGNGGCVLALEPDTATLQVEPDGPAASSEPSPSLP
jgi:hypothetical protein